MPIKRRKIHQVFKKDSPRHRHLTLIDTWLSRHSTHPDFKSCFPDILLTQECIPVGCVPPASMVISAVVCPGGRSVIGVYIPLSPEADTPLTQRQIPPCPIACWDTPPLSIACWDTPLPPVNTMTDRCKNITLPQTSFAGGNQQRNKLEE